MPLVETIDSELKLRLADRLDSHELVELLDINIHDLIDIFESEILTKLPEIQEYLNIEDIEEDD